MNLKSARLDRNYFARSLVLWGLCLVETAFFLPVIVLAHTYLVLPGYLSFPALCAFPLVSLAGVLVRACLPVLWKQIAASLLLGAGFAVLVAVVAVPESGTGLILKFLPFMLAGTFFALQGTTSAKRKSHNNLYWSGIAGYLLAGIFFPRFPQLAASVPLVTWSGVFCLAWALFSANMMYLRYSTFSEEGAGNPLPRGLRRHNMIWIGAIVLGAVMLAAGTGRWAGGVLLGLLREIFGWLFRPSDEPKLVPEEAVQPPAMEFPPPEAHEPGWLSQLLDAVFFGFGTLVVIALLAALLYWVYKNAGGIWRRWIDRLLSLLGQPSTEKSNKAYVDEETTLKAWESGMSKWRGWLGTFSSRRGRRERWEDLPDNRERIRYLYRRMLKAEQAEGYDLKPHFTPRETEAEIRKLPVSKSRSGKSDWEKRRSTADVLLGLYYRARYGELEPGDDEVARIKTEMKL
ncbi:uncharacterized protein DUF4129 [Fontibacillus phaseoli]|uniref:Uncharacterized protein DUF4129 n=1 Tax=Fontibacillus phaseoli TaxID=1416533 RepID=A0A369B9H6_9BACL|nr:DUF4129 domain-containing protein [Fontibacillus phaseoli]RCX18170.1 uncharacterized protein DUF4129 [Fontibacillus phaseoli]